MIGHVVRLRTSPWRANVDRTSVPNKFQAFKSENIAFGSPAITSGCVQMADVGGEEVQRNYDSVGAIAKLQSSERYQSIMRVGHS